MLFFREEIKVQNAAAGEEGLPGRGLQTGDEPGRAPGRGEAAPRLLLPLRTGRTLKLVFFSQYGSGLFHPGPGSKKHLIPDLDLQAKN
jgi:hypothetical protein